MPNSRHFARQCVLQAIFVLEFRGGTAEKILDYILKNFVGRNKKDKFIESLFKGVIKHKTKIWKIIQKYAPQWPIEKIAPIDRAILEIGLYEIMFTAKETPCLVAVNEAVELAKEFGAENSGKFINGVLSSAMEKEVKK